MDDNGNGQRSGMPKLFEIYRRQRQDSDASMGESPEIDFAYADSDSYENEISELYSYSEGPEFQLNLKAFESICNEAGVLALWQSMTEEKRFSLLNRITDQMEHCNSDIRANASRALLYIAQGCWGEVQSDQEQAGWVRRNCFTLLDCNAWSSCMQLLNMEIECWVTTDSASNNSTTSNNNNNKQQQLPPAAVSHVNLGSSSQLRVLLSVLYTLVETLRWPSLTDTQQQQRAREAFCEDLAQPQEETDELLAVTLLGMVTRFCNSSPAHFPIRKLLLLLWKLLLVTLGGSDKLRALKAEYRANAGLAVSGEEDTVTVCRGLRPASPPAAAADLIDQQQQQHNMVRRRPFRRSLMKQSSLDDSMGDLDLTGDDDGGSGSGSSAGSSGAGGSGAGSSGGTSAVHSPEAGLEDEDSSSEESNDDDSSSSDSGISDNELSGEEDAAPTTPPQHEEGAAGGGDPANQPMEERPASPRPPTPSIPHSPPPPPPHNKGLPWAPKVRQKDIDCFLDVSRDKFVGFQLAGDRTTLAGLPPPIHEGVHTLSKHVYTSLSEQQMKREEEINRNPLSRPELEVPQTPAEVLYQCLLPTLPQCMIALLKVLLAAAPTSKAKTDSINIMADVLPEEMPMTVVQSMKLGLDVNRHKEVLVKAVSASLLLLLKHLKLNHVYQFEFMSQHLVFANCIPLILKFFNQSIMSYVQAKNTIALLDFPSCVIGDGADLSNDALLASLGASAGGVGEGGEPNNMMAGDSSPSAAAATGTTASTSTSTTTSTTTTASGNTTPSNNNNNNNNPSSSSSSSTANNNNDNNAGGGGGAGAGTGGSTCCWRNMFSCINLLRVLNKLCKWKHSRIMMLVVFKSAPILKRTLMVRHSLMQLYVLKLLKMQTKYLGRQWRKSNMKTLSAIYQMVRHRLNDDWAYGNDPDARPWDFQTEECSLRAAVDHFNTRRYHQPHPGDVELVPVDNCITSVLGRHVELTEEFTRCYEVWLQREVLNTTIHWDLLLSTNTEPDGQAGLCTKCCSGSPSTSSAGKKGSAEKGSVAAPVIGSASAGKDKSSGAGTKSASATTTCVCGHKRLVSEGSGAAGSNDYTPLIQQLSGQFMRHDNIEGIGRSRTLGGEGKEDDEEEEEDEFDKKEKMQTMIKRTPSTAAAAGGSSGSTNGAVVEISLDEGDSTSEVCDGSAEKGPAAATKDDALPMEVDKKQGDSEEQL